MKTFSPVSNFFKLSLPDNWTYSENDGTLSFYDKLEGKGALQISCFSIDKRININLADELADFLKDVTEINKNELLREINIFNNKAFVHIIRNKKYFEYYLIYKSGKLLFVTYNCDQTDSLIEKPIIDKMIESIIL